MLVSLDDPLSFRSHDPDRTNIGGSGDRDPIVLPVMKANPQSGRSVIAAAIDVPALTALADSVANDAMQALLLVLKKRDLPGGLGDSRAMRESFRKLVLANIMTEATRLVEKNR